MFNTSTIEIDYLISPTKVGFVSSKLVELSNVVRVHLDSSDKYSRIVIVYNSEAGEAQVLRDVHESLANLRQRLEIDENVSNLDDVLLPRDLSFSLPNATNIVGDLIEQGLLVPIGDNDWGLAGKLLKLVQFFDSNFVSHLGPLLRERTGVPIQEMRFSPMISSEYVDRLQLLAKKPEFTFLVGHLCSDCVSKSIEPDFALQSAPCVKVYLAHEGRRDIEKAVFSVVGDCFRNEQKKLSSMERLISFQQREFVFLGPPDFLVEIKQFVLNELVGWLSKFRINCSCVPATDPFFLETSDGAGAKTPAVVKHEIRGTLPYAGRDISIASFDICGDFFTSAFDIGPQSERIWSGCIGLGLERMAYVFLQQYGLDEKQWPESVHIDRKCLLE